MNKNIGSSLFIATDDAARRREASRAARIRAAQAIQGARAARAAQATAKAQATARAHAQALQRRAATMLAATGSGSGIDTGIGAVSLTSECVPGPQARSYSV
ncbi:hypothetical protein ABTY98_23870 [Streptomyces sp. NPDC096040]|uniref:hypothetical protein n=1 Tax=Streptomyces sp. NPDC096040 TaxID=3155541 RepID=UPI00332DBDEE